jgi:hypothetical protein
MSDEIVQDELATLKARADRLGVQYHPSIGLEKLREKVNAALSDAPSEDPAPAAPQAAQPAAESLAQKRRRLRDEANELVRIRLTCMNPMKKEWPGEIITVGNSAVGTIKKFIPFTGADDGWHVPRIMLKVLQARQCQIFQTLKVKNGVGVRKGKLIKEFAIEVLPPLTAEELHDLAQRQAMAKSVD